MCIDCPVLATSLDCPFLMTPSLLLTFIDSLYNKVIIVCYLSGLCCGFLFLRVLCIDCPVLATSLDCPFLMTPSLLLTFIDSLYNKVIIVCYLSGLCCGFLFLRVLCIDCPVLAASLDCPFLMTPSLLLTFIDSLYNKVIIVCYLTDFSYFPLNLVFS